MEEQNNFIKVLFVVGDLGVGGVQSGIMNFVKICPREDVRFDIVIHSKEIGYYEEEFSKYGKVIHLPIKKRTGNIFSMLGMITNNYILRYKLKKYLKNHEPYDAIHCKSLFYCAATVEAGKAAGVPVRVAQSHVDKPDHLNPFHRWYYHWCAKRIQKNATDKLAVSPGAVDLMFGKYGGRVIKNPTINLSRFDPSKYDYKPEKDVIHLIHVGTFSHRKNQVFSIHILNELKNMGYDASLTFIGYSFDDPEYINDMKKCAEELELDKNIRYLPKDADVPYELSQSDYMLIPSLREGLPNVALESQAMGVPCFVSDTVNRDTDCGLCTFLSLDENSNRWAKSILKYREEKGIEKKYVDMSSWDNRNVVKDYIKIWNAKKR